MDSSQTTSSGSHNRKGQMTNINGTERRIETSKEPTTPVKLSPSSSVLTEEQLAHTRRVFHFLDMDKNGEIDGADLQLSSSLLGHKLWDSEIECMLTECTLDQPPSPSARSHRTSTSSATTPTAVNLDQFTSSVGCKVHQLDSREVLEAAFQNAISQNSLNDQLSVAFVKRLLCESAPPESRLSEGEWGQMVRHIPECIDTSHHTGHFSPHSLIETLTKHM
ncbi:uncharacterized protein LOC134847627 [Symsagittifera roscoffensis]|uniref:uncharacterized protein LOC134847627 n=1 Tax=Symsagittifera roscoffensis TaxID=84072 RepID=UPI00307C8A4E